MSKKQLALMSQFLTHLKHRRQMYGCVLSMLGLLVERKKHRYQRQKLFLMHRLRLVRSEQQSLSSHRNRLLHPMKLLMNHHLRLELFLMCHVFVLRLFVT